jgi:hypothetical protein
MADEPEIERRLFEGVMAPLVLGGSVRPGHAIGARAALGLGRRGGSAVDRELETRVQVARVRRARRLAPIDALAGPTPAEWSLAAALHDLLQTANPAFDSGLRRSAAGRILELAGETLERVPPPSDVREALSRHTWFARVLDIARTDTTVSWWSGSHTYRGVEPPRRLQAWPELRRVSVAAAPHALLELAPLAVERSRLAGAVARLLTRTPLTELATCTRGAPAFAWSESSLALVATRAGRTLALRALAGFPPAEVDAALGRATRRLLATRRAEGAPAVTLLAERTLGQAGGHGARPQGGPAGPDEAFARGLGAAAALLLLEASGDGWREDERQRLLAALEPSARTAEAREAMAMLGEAL